MCFSDSPPWYYDGLTYVDRKRMTALKIQGLMKVYGNGIQALSALTYGGEGWLYALLGPNGG